MIDPMTGKCKKTDDGCATEAAEAPRVLATVHLADWTGQLSNVLVAGPELAFLAPGQACPCHGPMDHDHVACGNFHKNKKT